MFWIVRFCGYDEYLTEKKMQFIMQVSFYFAYIQNSEGLEVKSTGL